MKPGRQADAERNRERILEAASELFSRHGYSGTRIAAICKAADVVPPTLYWHFESKEGLVLAVARRAAEQFHEQFAMSGDVPASFIADRIEERPEHVRLMMLLALERRDVDPGLAEALAGYRDLLKTAMAARVEPLLRIEEPAARRKAREHLVDLCMIMADGGFLVRHMEGDSFDVRTAIELFEVGLRAAAERLNRNPPTP